MLRKFRVALLVVIAAAIALPTAAWANGQRHRDCVRQLEEASAAFDQAFIDRDLEAFMAFIRDDALQVNSVGQIFNNKAEIEGFTAAVMANEYTFTHELLHQKLHRCESAIVVQDTVFSIPSRPLTVHLEDTVVWHRDRGEWKVALIQNTEIP